MRSTWLAGWVLACGLGAGAAFGQTKASGFCDRIKTLTADPTVAAAHWGVSVTALDGTVLCGINQVQLFRPASNNKLFTSAAALALLRPETTFTTSVYGEGKLTDGVLHGSLILVGGGDSNFGSAEVPYVEPTQPPQPAKPVPATITDIEELADQIVAKGVRAVEGDVVGDDSMFVWEPYPFGWEIDDLDTMDGAPVSALTIHDNWMEVDVTGGPTAADQPVMTTAPEVPYYAMEMAVSTSDAKQPCRGLLQVQHDVGSKSVRIIGVVPAATTCKLQLQIQDPAEFAALALKGALERRGVRIAGSAVAYHNRDEPPAAYKSSLEAETGRLAKAVLASGEPVGSDKITRTCSVSVAPQARGQAPGAFALAKHETPAMGDDLKFTLKVSQNLHAEMMMRYLGSSFSCGSASEPSQGLAVVQTFLSTAGIAKADAVLYDGSGLSGHDLVTPRALTQILVYAAKQKWFDAYKASLPVGGVDGTLTNRFLPPNSTLKGQVFAKTGTLGESRALSGYVTAASGRTVVFSVMVDNHPPGSSADRVVMDKIVETIASAN